MAYYQILKKRRLDLNLSIQDIAIQTHLSPEFIRAIEDNNLDVFSDDFSFVRYFVHSYADVIGVNWMAIAPEVDASISEYARARDMAITQAQQKMIENMPSSKRTKKRRKRRKSIFAGLASKLSRQMNWDPKNRLSRTVIITGVCVLGFLAVLSLAVDALSERNIQNAQLAKQQELKAKEEETQRLADQLKSQKGESGSAGAQSAPAPEITISPAAGQVNGFLIEGALSDSKPIDITFQSSGQMHVVIFVNGTQNTAHDFTGSWNFSLQSGTQTLVELEIQGYQEGDTITVNQKQVPIEASGFTEGYGVVSLQFNESQSAPASGESDQQDDSSQDIQDDGSAYESGYSDDADYEGYSDDSDVPETYDSNDYDSTDYGY